MDVHKNFAGLKFFRADHRDDEIHAEREGNDSENNVFHKIFRLKFFAADRVKGERSKKQDRRAEIDYVQHNFSNSQHCRDERNNAMTFLSWVNLRPRTSRIRGSPFQLPTRLAVGLGLESGLEISCLISFAPSSTLRILGLPCLASGRKPDFGCNGEELITAAGVCQSVSKLTLARANGNGVNT
jgi:hypothetical protein